MTEQDSRYIALEMYPAMEIKNSTEETQRLDLMAFFTRTRKVRPFAFLAGTKTRFSVKTHNSGSTIFCLFCVKTLTLLSLQSLWAMADFRDAATNKSADLCLTIHGMDLEQHDPIRRGVNSPIDVESEELASSLLPRFEQENIGNRSTAGGL
jgi:hypothetical protein